MDLERFSSVLLENAVRELSSLPGVGKKTALRLALHLLKRNETEVEQFGNAIIQLKKEIKYCMRCNNVSDDESCKICSDIRRDASIICVVEDIRDVMAIEATRQFNGLYHVLGGKISPMDGIGPGDLAIQLLLDRLKEGLVREVILALSTTVEGDTTNFYLYRKISSYPVEISTIARGIGIGDELEYADEVTLGRSILNRTPFQSSVQTR